MSSGGFKRYILISCFAVLSLAAADKTFSSCGIGVNAIGKSGKLRITRGKNSFEAQVDSLTELDENKQEVGKAINTLANQDFTFSDLDSNSSFQGIAAANVNLTANLTGLAQARLDIQIYVFCEAGNVTFGNESFEVINGTFKFNIELTGWEFCEGVQIPSLCKKDEVGKYLDLELVIKSKNKPKQSNDTDREAKKKRKFCHKKRSERDRGCPEGWDIGDGELLLNRGYERDGKYEGMAPGYPKFMEKGNKNIFVFRIGKFNGTVLIDPTVDMEEVSDDGGGDGGSGGDGGDGGGGGGGGNGGDENGTSWLELNLSLFVLMVAAVLTFV